jgi:hypothetical protein
MITDIFIAIFFFSILLAMIKPKFLYENYNNKSLNRLSFNKL